MDPKLTINLISNHSQEEVMNLARKVEQLASDYYFPQEKVLHDFPELQKADFSVSELRYVQLSLAIGIFKENPGIWFSTNPGKTVGDAIALTLDIALRLSPELVLDRFRASGVRCIRSGNFVFLSDRLTEGELADKAIDTSQFEGVLRDFAKVTGLSL